MATPPVFGAESESSFTANTTPKTQGLSVTAGDSITVVGLAANNLTTLGTPSDSVNTYTLTNSVVITDFCTAYIWKATAATTASLTISITRGGTGGDHWGFNAFNDSGSAGFGTGAKTNSTGAPSLGITTAADNSAIYVLVGDWNALSTSRTWLTVNSITPTSVNGHEKTYVQDGANYTIYVARYPDAGTAGAKTVGLSAPGGQKYSIIALEVKGSAAVAVTGTDTPSGLRLGGDSLTAVTATVLGSDTPSGLRLGAASTVTSGSATIAADTALSGLRLGADSGAGTTFTVVGSDSPSGLRLGADSGATAAIGITTPGDAPYGLRMGGDTGATVTYAVVGVDSPTGLRLGTSAATVTYAVVAADAPCGLRIGADSGASVTFTLNAADAPSGVRLGGDPGASAGSATLVPDTLFTGLRLGGDSGASTTSTLIALDTPSWFRLADSAVTTTWAVLAGDTPTGVRLGGDPGASAGSATLVPDTTITGLRLGGSSASSTTGAVLGSDAPSGLRIGSSPASVTYAVVAGDTPSGLRFGGASAVSTSSGVPTPVTAADTPGWIRLGFSPASVSIGLPPPPTVDIITYNRIPRLTPSVSMGHAGTVLQSTNVETSVVSPDIITTVEVIRI